MVDIKFYKYASNGNNFILIDELIDQVIPERNISQLSKYIENTTTGIGCDSMIILQRYAGNQHIISSNIYSINSAIYAMRVYENGIESNMCGNGLICVAHHLNRQYAINHAMVATEIPSNKHVFRNIQSLGNNLFKIELGNPRLPSNDFVNNTGLMTDKIYLNLKNISLQINIDQNEIKFILENCYITFTGEPHLVILRPPSKIGHNNIVLNTVFDYLFATNNYQKFIQGNRFINQIGKQINLLVNLFPKGININFAEIVSKNTVANRCYERGINSETYACGTGAAAVTAIIHAVGLLDSDKITILPWRARSESLYRDGNIMVHKDHEAYSLTARSLFLIEGNYYYPHSIRDYYSNQ